VLLGTVLTPPVVQNGVCRYQQSRHLRLFQRLCLKDQLRSFHFCRHSDFRNRRYWQVLVSAVAYSARSRAPTYIANYSHRYKDTQGTLYYNGSTAPNSGPQIYAAAYMVQSSPSMLCPYYNDSASYRSSTGLGYYVACGASYFTGTDIAQTRTTSKSSVLLLH